MKKLAIFLGVIILLSAAVLSAQNVMVRFYVNTATIPDTLGANSVVQLRGDTAPLTWGGDSGVLLTNIGGDYWSGVATFPANTTINYKIYTNAEHNTVSAGAGWEHQGWEADVATGNRVLTTTDEDTVVMLQFANGWQGGLDQYWRPYTTNDSTFVVYVRVNVQGWEDFSPSYQIGLRGSNQVDWGQTGEISWGQTYLLTQEQNHANGGSQRYTGGFFYSGPIHVPNQYAGQNIQYKVVIHQPGAALNEEWGNMVLNSDRQDVIAMSGNDTTIHWFWLNNLKPVIKDHQDTMVVTFRADMSKAIINKGFAIGDTIQVRSGYFGTAKEVRTKMLVRQGLSQVYAVTDTIIATAGDQLDYQYYMVKKGVEYREVYYNFYYAGNTTGEQERRIQENLSDGIIVADIVNSNSDPHRMPLFQNTELLGQNVLVTFTCDLRPAYYQVMAGDTLFDIQSNVDIENPDKVYELGVIINGPASGGWGTWGPALNNPAGIPLRKMFDDGTHGDAVAGDHIYAIQYTFYPDSGDVVGQEFKFGIGGGDNEGGYGNNHIENIDDTNPTTIIASQFGSIDPVFYSAWDYDTGAPTGVEELDAPVPVVFSLERNYPNPFNPETNIRYNIPKDVQVTLTVYSVLGTKIATLVDQNQKAGSYVAHWDGKDNRGLSVSSGVYFYKLVAGDFTATYKMLLMK